MQSLRRIIVINAKGGCGKTTVATNLASGYAVRGYRTALMDYDPQGSSLQWLKARPADAPPIQGVAMLEGARAPLSGAWQMRIARDTQRVVVDTQAGVRPLDLAGRLTAHDLLVVPIQPSAIDIRATADFIRDLLLTARVRPQDGRLAIIGNRTRRSTQSYAGLQRFLDSLRIPVLAHLRDSQSYAIAAEQGVGVCELPPQQARGERSQWLSILDWLERGAPEAPAATAGPVHGLRPTAEPRPAAPRPLPAAPGPAPARALPAFLTQPWDPLADLPAPATPKELN